MLDSDDRILEANKGFEQLFQYRIVEIRGRAINEVIVPEDLCEERKRPQRT